MVVVVVFIVLWYTYSVLSSKAFESFQCLWFVSETATFRKPFVITLNLWETPNVLLIRLLRLEKCDAFSGEALWLRVFFVVEGSLMVW